MEDLTWKDLEQVAKDGGIVLVPVGSTEPHGPHLTLLCDALHADAVAKRTADKSHGEFPVVVAPLLPYGCSREHRDFPGYMSPRIPTFLSVITELVTCLVDHGLTRVVLINGHGGNVAPLEAAVSHIRDELGVIVGVCHWAWLTSDLQAVDHAGVMETSLMLHIHPSGVNQAAYPPGTKGSSQSTVRFRIPMPRLKEINPEGFMGDPKEATAELGQQLVEKASDMIVEYLREVYTQGKVVGQFI
jgi:creatinine amidohydrolase